jgi:hypothetical protein
MAIKRGVGYLLEATVDCKNGIITGVDVYPANEKESLLILRHLERQQNDYNLQMQRIALDRGYDTGAVHRGLELWVFTGYIPAIRFPNCPAKYGFQYQPATDTISLPNGPAIDLSPAELQSVHRQISSLLPGAGGCMRNCAQKGTCFEKTGVRRRILASSCYPSFYRGHLRVGTPEYWT